MHGLDNHEQRLHHERFAELRQEADRCAHELVGAKAEADQLRATIRTMRLHGRSEVHQEITASVIDAMRKLQDAVMADQQFCEKLAKDLLRFGPPLQTMAADTRGGPGWIDGLMPVLAGWIEEIEQRDPYHVVSQSPAKPKLQLA